MAGQLLTTRQIFHIPPRIDPSSPRVVTASQRRTHLVYHTEIGGSVETLEVMSMCGVDSYGCGSLRSNAGEVNCKECLSAFYKFNRAREARKKRKVKMAPPPYAGPMARMKITFKTSCCGDVVEDTVDVPVHLKYSVPALTKAVRVQLNNCAREIMSAEEVPIA